VGDARPRHCGGFLFNCGVLSCTGFSCWFFAGFLIFVLSLLGEVRIVVVIFREGRKADFNWFVSVGVKL